METEAKPVENVFVVKNRCQFMGVLWVKGARDTLEIANSGVMLEMSKGREKPDFNHKGVLEKGLEAVPTSGLFAHFEPVRLHPDIADEVNAFYADTAEQAKLITRACKGLAFKKDTSAEEMAVAIDKAVAVEKAKTKEAKPPAGTDDGPSKKDLIKDGRAIGAEFKDSDNKATITAAIEAKKKADAAALETK